MCSLKQAFILKQLYITSSSVRLHKATWPAGFRTWGLGFHTRAVFLRLCHLYVCVFQREELWSTCVDSAEVSIWHIKDTSKPFHRLVLPDCGSCHCLIKVKNQVGKHTHTHAHTHTPPKALRPQLWLLCRCGSEVLAAAPPKGRSTSWTPSATRSWRSCTATATRWRRSARPRTATSSAGRGKTTARSQSGRWSSGGLSSPEAQRFAARWRFTALEILEALTCFLPDCEWTAADWRLSLVQPLFTQSASVHWSFLFFSHFNCIYVHYLMLHPDVFVIVWPH